MKCYAEQRENKLTYYLEEVPKEYEDTIIAAFFKKDGDRYIKEYKMCEYIESEHLAVNFGRLAERMFKEGGANWDKALIFWINACKKYDIEWYLRGSAADAVRGADLVPHDLDIAVHTRDFFKIKDIFRDYVIEPFIDNKGTWVVRYFGRLCLEGVMVDVDADESENAENYPMKRETERWRGYEIMAEPFVNRYQTEILRGRTDRIKILESVRLLREKSIER